MAGVVNASTRFHLPVNATFNQLPFASGPWACSMKHSPYGDVPDTCSWDTPAPDVQGTQGRELLGSEFDDRELYEMKWGGVATEHMKAYDKNQQTEYEKVADKPKSRAKPRPATRKRLQEAKSQSRGKELVTLLRDEMTVVHRPGTGPGKHALNKMFEGSPFPVRNGGLVAQFKVRFEEDFEWGCRGKIGGFGIGPGPADGGEHKANGASLRVMWNSGGGAFVYVYVPAGSERHQPPGLDRRARYGLLLFEREHRRAFEADTWHTVRLGLRLNTFDGDRPNNDGTLMLDIDGHQETQNHVIWRLRPEFAIEHFGFGIFHGGPCRATRTSRSAYKDLKIFKL